MTPSGMDPKEECLLRGIQIGETLDTLLGVMADAEDHNLDKELLRAVVNDLHETLRAAHNETCISPARRDEIERAIEKAADLTEKGEVEKGYEALGSAPTIPRPYLEARRQHARV